MFLLLSFMFFLLQNWRTGEWNRFCAGGVAPVGGGGGWERSRRVNMVQILYIQVCKCENVIC
jgi:hypothetical protein